MRDIHIENLHGLSETVGGHNKNWDVIQKRVNDWLKEEAKGMDLSEEEAFEMIDQRIRDEIEWMEAEGDSFSEVFCKMIGISGEDCEYELVGEGEEEEEKEEGEG